MAVDILGDLRTLINATDAVSNIYIRKASTAIIKYLNIDNDTDVASTYPDAVIQYVVENYNKRGNESLKQFSQGSRSGTFESGLSQEVKDLLPLPFITMMGC